MKIISPLRAEFGLKLWWHVPVVHAIEGPKVVYHEPGDEALYPSADVLIEVERQEDELRRNRYERDIDFVRRIEAEATEVWPDAEILRPQPQWPKKRFVPEPAHRWGIEPDVVVCPRWRTYGPAKNWPGWIELADRLKGERVEVFAAGAPDSSCPIGCERAWDYTRFFDASLEAVLNARLVIATDAGLAHLAVLCGTPLLVITHEKGLVAPGPSEDETGRVMDDEYWPIKTHRYEEANHLGSPINFLDRSWYDMDLIVNTALEMMERPWSERTVMVT